MQSIVRLPEMVDFKIGRWPVIIWDHRITDSGGLLNVIKNLAGDMQADRETLSQFEDHGISYETAIECCIGELEEDPHILAEFIYWDYKIEKSKKSYYQGKISNELGFFVNSEMGRNIADHIIEKLRDCQNWGELYDEMHPDSKFNEDIIKQIREEMT